MPQRRALPAEAIDAIERAATSAHRHEELFSERAANIRQSAVRDVFDISLRPGLVSLAGGSPYLQSLPLDRLAATAARIIAEEGLTALQYGAGQGTDELRTQICEVMAAEGIVDALPQNVVVTAGSQSAQDVATKVFCNPGDVVLVEDPTYVGRPEHLRGVPGPGGNRPHGRVTAWSPSSSRRASPPSSWPARPSSSSTPSPASTTLPASPSPRTGASEIVDICRNANILILEDNPYGLLRFDGGPLAPLRAANPDDVIYMGSFSKIFAPGLRIGWALVPAHLQRRYYLAAESVTLCPPALNQMLVSAYLRDYDWKGQIETYRGLYAERCRAMLGSARGAHAGRVPPGPRPDGGFFVWVTLPEGVDTYPLLLQGHRGRRGVYSGGRVHAVGRTVQQTAPRIQRRPAGCHRRRSTPAGAGPSGSHRRAVA